MTMTINGKEYKLKELDFNTICELEETGINLMEIEKKPFVVIRGFLAVNMGLSVELAGKEIERHIMAGGSLIEPIEKIGQMIEESGFFQALTEEK